MDCGHCGKTIETESTFCRFCGARTAPGHEDQAAPVGPDQPRKLFRRSTEGRIAGVCAGIAEYLHADVTMVRLVWVILSIVPGGFIGGVVAYIAAWMIMPDAPAAVSPVRPLIVKRLTRSVVDRKIAGVCGGLAEYLRVDATLVRVVWIVLAIVPGAIVLGVAAYLVAWFIMPEGEYHIMTPSRSAA